VAIRHQSLVNYTQFICRSLRIDAPLIDALSNNSQWHFATVSPLTADLGNTCIFPSLISGGCLHLLSYEVATNSDLFADYLSQHPIDVLKIVPSHMSALLASQPEGSNVLPRRYLILGGEALSFELARHIATLPSTCEIINHYGPTEATIGALTFALRETANQDLSSTVPIGRPIANTEVYILDLHMQPVPMGVPGELYLGGAGLAQGYLNQPDRTAERFVPHPFARGAAARLYKTGDLARYLPDGNVEFLGRLDHQVKIRGFRVELEEIEVVLGRHPAVRQAVVLARENESHHTRLVAYVVPRGTPAVSTPDLQSYLKNVLPEYMMPSAFVLLGALPLMSNGKVDRKALPAPDQVRAEGDTPYVAPRTPAEALLARIWAQVLGRRQVGIYDNFFSDLGGDSIISIQIIARANQAGLRLTPKQMFEHQTIAALAAVAGSTAAVQAEQGLVQGPLPLTAIQQWFFAQQFPDPHHWNQAILLEVRQPLDPIQLDQVVQHLLAHHDALRLRFHLAEAGWQQVNDGLYAAAPFAHIDLSVLPEHEHRATIEAAAAALQASLNLSQGPLLRIAYVDLGAHVPSRLLMAVHHLAIDGVSWRILLEDLQTGYQQLSRGEAVRLPAKTTSFKHWAERLSEYAQSRALHQELDYWLAASRRQVRRLPVDYPEGVPTVPSSRMVTVTLTPEETHALLHEVPEAYHTQINDVLLTALVQAFARWTGARALLVELEGHGREQLVEGMDPWRTVGWFTTHMPVLLDLGRSTTPGDALKLIKEQLRAMPNRGIGYGLLRYLSGDMEIAEKLRAFPQPEVAFNYLGQFDQILPESSPFGPARESAGPLHSTRGNISYLLSVGGSISGGQLQLTCTYSENMYQHATIEELAQGLIKSLQVLIAHCQSPEAKGYTPSDFSLASLDEQKLSRIASLIQDIDAFEEETC
jgi:non-ribosomal peptide synthase protein (TIGR01720 family)